MIVFSRATARRFRSVLRRSVMAAAPRGPAPPVLAIADAKGVTLRSTQGDVGLTLRVEAEEVGSGQIAFPGELLNQLEGAGNEPVVLDVLLSNKGQARWEERGVPKMVDFELIDPAKIAPLPQAKQRLAPMPYDFMKDLDDACRTAARDPGRYALNKIQFRCHTGQLVASDGRQLLLQGGFQFPFGEDFLVPALPVFGAKDLLAAEPVLLGRSDNRLLMRAGLWCIDLQIDAESRFPQVEQVIPSEPNPTRLTLGEGDAKYLIEAVPALPGEVDDDPPHVTLDLGREALVRARGSGKAVEVLLSNSRVSGPEIRVAVNREYLVRTLRMGFRTIEVHSPSKPVVAREGQRVMVFMVMDAKGIVEPSIGVARITAPGTSIPVQPRTETRVAPVQLPTETRVAPGRPPTETRVAPVQPPTETRVAPVQPPTETRVAPVQPPRETKIVPVSPKKERNTIMAASPNGANGHPTEQPDNFDPLAECEALRTALQDALNRNTRLIAGLRQFRKQHKAVANAITSLRQFQLTP